MQERVPQAETSMDHPQGGNQLGTCQVLATAPEHQRQAGRVGADTERPMGLFVPAKRVDFLLQGGGSPQEEGGGQSKRGKAPYPLVGMGGFEFPTWSVCLV